MQQPNQQLLQKNEQPNYRNNQGVRQVDRDANNARLNFYPSKPSSGLKINERTKSAQNKENIPSYNSKTYVDNRGKVDVKREINKDDNVEKLKVPGRDLKEAKISHNLKLRP